MTVVAHTAVFYFLMIAVSFSSKIDNISYFFGFELCCLGNYYAINCKFLVVYLKMYFSITF